MVPRPDGPLSVSGRGEFAFTRRSNLWDGMFVSTDGMLVSTGASRRQSRAIVKPAGLTNINGVLQRPQRLHCGREENGRERHRGPHLSYYIYAVLWSNIQNHSGLVHSHSVFSCKAISERLRCCIIHSNGVRGCNCWPVFRVCKVRMATVSVRSRAVWRNCPLLAACLPASNKAFPKIRPVIITSCTIIFGADYAARISHCKPSHR